jgi:hypothetical protein
MGGGVCHARELDFDSYWIGSFERAPLYSPLCDISTAKTSFSDYNF